MLQRPAAIVTDCTVDALADIAVLTTGGVPPNIRHAGTVSAVSAFWPEGGIRVFEPGRRDRT